MSLIKMANNDILIEEEELPIFEEEVISEELDSIQDNDIIEEEIVSEVEEEVQPEIQLNKAKVKDEDEDEDDVLAKLQAKAEQEAMSAKLEDAYYQIQQLNDQIKTIYTHQQSGQHTSVINEKKSLLEQARQEYQNARMSFDTNAELKAMEKYSQLDFEIKQLELESKKPQQANSIQQNQIPQNVGYDPHAKAREKLNNFVGKQEHSWMKEAFDANLNPLTSEALIANNVFKDLLDKGRHPGTEAFWDLYSFELRKKIPNKYASHYGKGSPAMATSSNSVPKSKPQEAKLNSWENKITSELAKGDDKKKKRIVKQLKSTAPHGNGNTMFEIGT
jgi:hypothetical protein